MGLGYIFILICVTACPFPHTPKTKTMGGISFHKQWKPGLKLTLGGLLSSIPDFCLFAAPSGKPTITTAHNKSSSSIHISWRPPHPDTIHGEFLGYRITYRPRDRGEDAFKEIYIRDPNVEVRRRKKKYTPNAIASSSWEIIDSPLSRLI